MIGAKRTKKQRIVVELIMRAADAGELHNVTSLYKALPYTCAYGSLRMTLKHLRNHGIIAVEKVGRTSVLKPTMLAYTLFPRRAT